MCHGGRSSGDTLTLQIPNTKVSFVRIYNRRTSCCYERLNNAQVKVGGVSCGTVSAFDVTARKNFIDVTCGAELEGTTVQIITNQALNLMEVEVYTSIDRPTTSEPTTNAPTTTEPTTAEPTTNAPTTSDPTTTNKVEIKSAALTTTYGGNVKWGYHAWKCIDGDISTMCHGGRSSGDTLTLQIPNTKVSFVRIYNRRTSCCYERLNNAQVKVGGVSCGTVSAFDVTARKNFIDVTCGAELEGTTVQIITNQALNLMEVEVYTSIGN